MPLSSIALPFHGGKTRRLCFILTGLALASVAALPARAQQRTEPFSTVEFSLSGTSNINRNFLHVFWKPGAGIASSLSTPFYFGFLEFGGALHRYNAVRDDIPGFGAVWLYMGWGLGVDVANRLRLDSSARLGNYRMSFDEENEFSGVVNESELGVMLNARLAVRTLGPVYVYASGSYLQAYTFLRLKLWYASVGISLRVPAANGLKKFLQ